LGYFEPAVSGLAPVSAADSSLGWLRQRTRVKSVKRSMAAATHDKFVLKEKLRLQQKEKELEKRSAEVASKCEALDSELRAKTAQLEQTASLLRKASEEREMARKDAAAARAEAVRAAEALRSASEATVSPARMAEAESLAAKASQEAVEVRAALRSTTESLVQSDDALRTTTAALDSVRREAEACQKALLQAEQLSAETNRRLTAALDAVAAFKSVVAHALAR
jgi:chromosome segregation ATPase